MLAVCIGGLPNPCLGGARWPQFRGTQAAGTAVGEKTPIHFGPSQSVLWKTALAVGHSSPCIWEDRIFLTAFEGPQKLETICLRCGDGKVLWRQVAPAQQIEMVGQSASADANPAASTPTTDGTNVCVYFGSFGLLCYDFEGKQKWQLPLAIPKTDFGTGTSPVLFRGRLLLNRDQNGDSFLMALDAGTGRQLWKTDRPLAIRGFSTPLVYHNGTVEEVIVSGNVQLAAYDLKDGALRWFARGLPSFDVCPSPVAGEGLIFAGGVSNEGIPASPQIPDFKAFLNQFDSNKDGKLQVQELPKVFKAYAMAFDADKNGEITNEEWDKVVKYFAKGDNAIVAVRPDGQGDLTQAGIVWRQRRGVPRVATPLYYEGRLYVIKDGGLLSCFRAKDGKPLFELERLDAEGEYLASPVAADGRIYLCSRTGVIVVVEAGDKLRILERNSLGEPIYATPAIAGGNLYVRTTARLYAFGDK